MNKVNGFAVVGDAHTISRAQIDALSVVDAHRLCCGIRDAAKSDEGADCFGPMIDMIECSIMDRPSTDVQTLAAKVWAASFPFDSMDPAQLALRDEIKAILSKDDEGAAARSVAVDSSEGVTFTRANVDALSVVEARALFLALWYSTDSDQVSDMIEGLADLLRGSIMDRPSTDVQTLAAKVWAVLLPIDGRTDHYIGLKELTADIECALAVSD